MPEKSIPFDFAYLVTYIGGNIQLLRTQLEPGKLLALLHQRDAFTVKQYEGGPVMIQFANVAYIEELTPPPDNYTPYYLQGDVTSGNQVIEDYIFSVMAASPEHALELAGYLPWVNPPRFVT